MSTVDLDMVAELLRLGYDRDSAFDAVERLCAERAQVTELAADAVAWQLAQYTAGAVWVHA